MTGHTLTLRNTRNSSGYRQKYLLQHVPQFHPVSILLTFSLSTPPHSLTHRSIAFPCLGGRGLIVISVGEQLNHPLTSPSSSTLTPSIPPSTHIRGDCDKTVCSPAERKFPSRTCLPEEKRPDTTQFSALFPRRVKDKVFPSLLLTFPPPPLPLSSYTPYMIRRYIYVYVFV